MREKIGIINYGVAGNIHSVKKALLKAGACVEIVDNANALAGVDKIILPGVGSFIDGIEELKKDALLEPLKKEILKKPTLGICLGMQLLSTVGFEGGETKGLAIIQAQVQPIRTTQKVPNMGFRSIDVISPSPILAGVENESFYFMHSYEVANYKNVSSITDYFGHQIVSSIQSIEQDTIFGVQFHPEKSRDAGIEIFRNFLKV